MSNTHDQSRKSLKQSFLSYLQFKMLAMLALGFASGLPFMMYFSKLSRWLADAGVDKSTIGFFYWIGLAYALKFLWAPVVDRAPIPVLTKWLGQRRSWMMAAIAGTVFGLFLISTWHVENGLGILVLGAFILTYSGATVDISVDAWRIESAPNDEQGNMAAAYQLGYRFAIIAAGFAMAGADIIGWNGIYLLMAGIMALNFLVVLLVKEPEHSKRKKNTTFRQAFQANVIDPYLNFISRFGRWTLAIFALVALYRLSDFTMGVMTQPFYADIGYTKTQVGLITGVFGPWPLIGGTFIGGFFCVRYGLMKSLLIGAGLTIITTAAFAWLATLDHPSSTKLFITIGADNIAGGFVGTVFIAYMSSLADRKYAATQYALLSSAYAFFCKFIAGFSGVVYEAVGAVNFFFLTAAYTIPAIGLIIYIQAKGPQNAKGIRTES
ncbi:MAG TPA: MFS transporter [Hellea balneolensis]|uniref:MFS transporter n=1 Tax=Hellea balneolensis TaxID=287478 RepID=A0A7C5QWR9_9PROT|nr:MFS transporter [Hellea balneolensis]